MENEHRDHLVENFGVTEDRIFVLHGGVVNPRFGDLDTYRRCRNQIITEVGNILLFLKSIEKDKVRLYFVRHAESDLSVREDDVRPLTPKGFMDALKVTAALKDSGITKVYSSPYVRAVDTVRDLAEKLSLEVVRVDDLRERTVGGWVEDFHTYSKKQWEDFSFKNPGGESLAEVQERNMQAVHTIIEDNLGSSVVIGTHGTALSTILNYFDPTFGYDDFCQIIDKTPYVLCLTMDRTDLVSITEVET
jgi:2,3-bisphosphoglycerate-dependent phosphoglycerate mutase